jgi:hypothetical protein
MKLQRLGLTQALASRLVFDDRHEPPRAKADSLSRRAPSQHFKMLDDVVFKMMRVMYDMMNS